MKCKILLLIVFLSCGNAVAQWTGFSSMHYTTYSLIVDNNNIFAGTWLNGLYVSMNGSNNWNSANSGIPSFTSGHSFCNNGGIIFSGTNKGVYLSSDNGANWISANVGIPANTSIYSLVASGSDIFAGTWGNIFKSSNNGVSWISPNPTFFGNMNVNALAKNGNILFAGASGGGVYSSTDNGTSWILSGLVTYSIEVIIIYNSNIFVGTTNGLFMSNDNGFTWSPLGLVGVGVLTIAIDGVNMFAGSNGSGVYFSNDNGNNWSLVNYGLPSSALAVSSILINNSFVFAATNDGVYKRDINQITNLENIEDALNYKISSSSTSSTLSILFDKYQVMVEIKLYDYLGKLVSSTNFTGTECIINRQTLSSGLYIVCISDRQNTHGTQKIFLQ